MELKVYKRDGSELGKTVKLNDEIFNIDVNDHAIWLDVRQYLANCRQGTHSSKEKSTLSGSTRKLKKQKGTGGARAGSIKSPLMRGGARVFGPHPRTYNIKLNKKVKELARLSALTYKARENNIIVVEDFSFEKPNTKNYVSFLSAFNVNDKRTLLITPVSDRNMYLSARNLPKADVVTMQSINTYRVLNAGVLVILEGALNQMENLLK